TCRVRGTPDTGTLVLQDIMQITKLPNLNYVITPRLGHDFHSAHGLFLSLPPSFLPSLSTQLPLSLLPSFSQYTAPSLPPSFSPSLLPSFSQHTAPSLSLNLLKLLSEVK